jgi:hypothetical protein
MINSCASCPIDETLYTSLTSVKGMISVDLQERPGEIDCARTYETVVRIARRSARARTEVILTCVSPTRRIMGKRICCNLIEISANCSPTSDSRAASIQGSDVNRDLGKEKRTRFYEFGNGRLRNLREKFRHR